MSSQTWTRREWLRRVSLVSGGAVAAAAWPDWAYALGHQPGDQIAAMRAQLGAAPITNTSLGPNLTMLAGPGGNVVVLNGGDGKVVVRAKARYVRVYSDGNFAEDVNHYTEVEVYGVIEE